jgi:hypothetical protein
VPIELPKYLRPNGAYPTPDTEVWIGKESSRWPLEIFTTVEQAMGWLSRVDDCERRLWRATIHYGPELELVQPSAYLQDKNSGDGEEVSDART